ncbi:hypothetical protein E2C01_033518 [Portunus trituberculatus]|uniref:Uncharacterized protein n=1 Tax=Portunus trituberculatus TaxID=210409 RepID=A0A5B7F4E9_PORTR|nr:hypothetical protein [Portunus trituberculatus]
MMNLLNTHLDLNTGERRAGLYYTASPAHRLPAHPLRSSSLRVVKHRRSRPRVQELRFPLTAFPSLPPLLALPLLLLASPSSAAPCVVSAVKLMINICNVGPSVGERDEAPRAAGGSAGRTRTLSVS